MLAAVVPMDRPNASANTLATLCSPPSALCTFWDESSCGAPSLPQLPGSSGTVANSPSTGTYCNCRLAYSL
eukprot:scaffold38282_cov39-Attheya_sp.AAC.1